MTLEVWYRDGGRRLVWAATSEAALQVAMLVPGLVAFFPVDVVAV